MARKKTTKPKSSFNPTLILVLIVLILGVVIWMFVRTVNTQKGIIAENKSVVERLNTEKETCKSLVNQGKGSFAEYEYCKRLIEKFK